MIAVLSIALFSGALTISSGVIVLAIGPQWRRIVRLAMGNVEQQFAPLTALASAERRIAVRRWASSSPQVRHLRAAA